MIFSTIYLSVGSNIHPEIHVPSALNALRRSVEVTGLSTHYRTKPLGNRCTEDDYLNGVWRIETSMTVGGMLTLLDGIERDEGRLRSSDRYAPRTMDLDLLLWGALVDRDSGLPDGDVLERPFLYHPLIELDPGLVWPLTGQLLKESVPADPPDIPADVMRPDFEMTERLRGMLDG